ncbi:uncharacterized protein LOC106162268 [Lingula anatina]|uniref:Uncharacterized protein LOC106162268 n=1 Tax=Lingula anatina TaxID=7574 RepID=A0A1S3I9K9_LINAN|nr:uncharacterized protein LOC106162268 [Lingula anatina]|eukprot:XP_013394942.1 uncharacterized protein LOC106162268 [Lingula anatina]
MDITCLPGTQAEPCNAGDPSSSSCIPCPEGQYQTRQTTLSDRLTCSVNLNCTQSHREYVTRGSSTTESVCGTCLVGYKETAIGTCIKNMCPIGQEPKGNGCQWCGTGNFSAEEDNKPCKRRTICNCTLMEGNATMDNRCSLDVSLCNDAYVTAGAPTELSSVDRDLIVALVVVGVTVIVIVGAALLLVFLVKKGYVTCPCEIRRPKINPNDQIDIEDARQSDDVVDDVGPTSEIPRANSSDSLASSTDSVNGKAPIPVSDQSQGPHPSMTSDQSKQDGYESQPSLANNENPHSQTLHKDLTSINSARASTSRTEDVGPIESMSLTIIQSRQESYDSEAQPFFTNDEDPDSQTVHRDLASINSAPSSTTRTEDVRPNGSMNMTINQSRQESYESESQPFSADNMDLNSQTPRKDLASINTAPASTGRKEAFQPNGSIPVNENASFNRQHPENDFSTTCEGEQPSSTRVELEPVNAYTSVRLDSFK